MAAPKLLEKRAVNVEVAAQKAHQIQTGLALAKKVDAVRETLGEEEQRLEKFRTESIAHVQGEIDAKIGERNTILRQIADRKEELAELRKPLDSEWEALRKQKAHLDQELIALYQRKGELEQAIALNVQRERVNREEEQRIAEEKIRTTAFLSQADELRKVAQKEFEATRAQAQRIIINAKEREEAVIIREQEVAEQEREVELVKAQQVKTAQEQAMKDKEIADKYQTLMRTQQRLHG